MSRFPIWKALRAFHDPVVSFRAGAQRLKRFLASLAIVDRQRDVVAVEFDNNRPQWSPGLVGLNPACGPVKKRPPND